MIERIDRGQSRWGLCHQKCGRTPLTRSFPDVYKSIRYIAEASRQYGPPGAGLSKSLADSITSPADLTEGQGMSDQRRDRSQKPGLKV